MTAYVTKFFAAKDLHHFEAGSIKLGTLEEYSSIENKIHMGARYDPDEGAFTEEFNLDLPFAENVNVPNAFEIIGCTDVKVEGFRRVTKINEWVFCASIGGYSKQRHSSILNRSSSGYPGNPSLVGYAVFDLEKLVGALEDVLPQQQVFSADPNEQLILGGPVQYDKAVNFLRLKYQTTKVRRPN